MLNHYLQVCVKAYTETSTINYQTPRPVTVFPLGGLKGGIMLWIV